VTVSTLVRAWLPGGAFPRAAATILLIAGPWCPSPARAAIPRDDDAVLVSASGFAVFLGRPVGDLFVFRWDASLQGFVPVPYQLDEVVDHVFNPGTPLQVVERMYDVLHEDDGVLDALDELAVLYSDAGTARAPQSAAWPAGSDADRYEIEVVDPRPGAPTPSRWLYLFGGTALPRSATGYVTWNGLASGSIATDRFALDFTDRWLLTGYRVFAPCGSGADLIDRVKGRAYLALGTSEDEERWNQQSAYLGGIAGPVRAIRYVLGAASGVNTTHHDLVYRNAWVRVVNLRVHPVDEVRLYTDWRPTPAGTMLYTPLNRDGVPIDGRNDPAVSDAWVDWTVVRHPDGGAVSLMTVPPSSLYTAKRFQYRDDASFNDAIPTDPSYPDEDDASYGSDGVILDGVHDTNVQAISMTLRTFPQCGGVGDASLGDEYASWLQHPLTTTVTRETRLEAPIRTLSIARSGDDLECAWQPVVGALAYRVYAAAFPSLPHDQWTLAGETVGTQLTLSGAALDPATTFLSAVPVGAAGEGAW
jgi:hypothetical protein